jgi:hypothetical protein
VAKNLQVPYTSGKALKGSSSRKVFSQPLLRLERPLLSISLTKMIPEGNNLNDHHQKRR